MADRTQNIYINYKFPMAEAEKASQILNRINQTNNLVQQGAQKTGQTVANSYNAAGKSIESMNIQLARLKTQIQVSSDPKRVADLSNQYKVLKQQIDAANKSAFETPKAMKATAAATQSVAQQFGQLYQAAKLLVTAGIVREVVDITLNLATLKGNVESVEAAFKRSIPNEVAVLTELRRATKGTITDFELMKQALQAQNFGLPVEKLGRLLEFATAKAQQTGLSIDYITNSLVTGLGRKSERVFDNLQLDIAELRKRIASGLDFREAGIQLIEEDLKRMGGTMVTTATQADQLKESWEALRIEFAKKIESGPIIGFFEGAIDGLRDLIKGNKEVSEEFLRTIGAEQAARVKESQAFKDAGDDRQKQFDVIQQEINTRLELIGRTNDNIAAKKEEIKNAQVWSNSLQKFIKTTRGPEVDAINEAIAALEKRKFVQAAAILALKDYLKEIQNINNEEKKEPTGIIERKKKEIEDLQRQLEKTNTLSDLGAGGKLTKALEIAQAELGDLQRAFREFHIKEFKFSMEEATAELNKFIKAGEKINAEQLKQRFEIGLEELAKAVPEKLPEIKAPSGFDAFIEDISNAWSELRQEVAVGGVDILKDQLIAQEQLELDSMKNRLKHLQSFYNEQQLLAGDNEKARELLRLREIRETTKLQREIFEKEKQTRKSQALIDGAAGVVKAFATYPYPAAIIISGLIAAQTLSQIRIINKQRPGFKKGVIGIQGEGTETSDSIPVNVSRNESIMTAWETQHAGDVLREIRAKRLDNKVLKELKQGRPAVQQQFNDERIIKAIEKNRPPDVIEQSGIVYKATKKSDTYLSKIRAKSVRL